MESRKWKFSLFWALFYRIFTWKFINFCKNNFAAHYVRTWPNYTRSFLNGRENFQEFLNNQIFSWVFLFVLFVLLSRLLSTKLYSHFLVIKICKLWKDKNSEKKNEKITVFCGSIWGFMWIKCGFFYEGRAYVTD